VRGSLEQFEELPQDSGALQKIESQEKSKIEPLLDPKALANLRAMVGGEGAYLIALIDSFLKDGPQLLQQMRQALAQENIANLRLAAHTLKSLANNFGAASLARPCKELENLGRSGVFEGSAELVSRAESSYEQVQQALEITRKEFSE
jgi:HPt (histidine-containing phosphotransfer) domain-containing protein